VFSIGNLGVLAGALLSERVGRWIGLGPTIVWSALFSSFALLAVAVAPREAPVPFLIAGTFIGTVTAVVYNVNQVSLRQAITPDRMLGRMNATMRFIVWGTIPIGALIGAVLGTVIGLQATIWVGAIGSFLGFVPVLLSPVRSLREIPSSEPA
jgi:predicted MFS family arabinose efflux permease